MLVNPPSVSSSAQRGARRGSIPAAGARRFGAWLLLLGAALPALAPGVAAQGLPRRVNCGDLNGFPAAEPGWEELLSEGAAPAGVSLSPPPLDTVHVAGNFPNVFGTHPTPSDVASVDPDQLGRTHRFTSLKLADHTVLSLTGLPADTLHRVKLEVGALFPWIDPVDPIEFEFKPTLSRGVRIETQDHGVSPGIGWRTYASGLRCETSGHAATYETFVSSIVDVWVLARSDAAGTLRLRLSTDGADPLFLSGFELHEHEQLPMHYHRGPGGPLVSNGAGANDFVAAFNAGDFAAAEQIALATGSNFRRGVELLHLIGWLDGSRDGYLHHLPAARAALQAASANHPACAWLLDEIDSFQRALDHRFDPGHWRKRACPEDGGHGFLNPECAGQAATGDGESPANLNPMIAVRELRGLTAARSGPTVLDALVERNAGTLPVDAWEPSPLVFTAAKLVGTTLHAINPQFVLNPSDPDALAMDLDKRALLQGFVDLGFAAADFPDDIELLVFDGVMEAGISPNQWSTEDLAALLTPAQIDASWWEPLVAAGPTEPGAPAWATAQRDHDRILRGIGSHWLLERIDEHELGGGWGDDIELMGLLTTVYAPKQLQQDRRILDALEGMARYGLVEQGEVQDGYHVSVGLADVEHSAEYTTYPYYVMRNVYGHSARSAEIAMGAARHLLSADAPGQAWAGINNAGRTHFKSEAISSEGPVLEAAWMHDSLLNGKATFPGLSLAHFSATPANGPLLADLTTWAGGWRDDMLSTAGGKPAGWHGEVQWPSGVMGNAGLWWSNTGSPADVWNLTSGVTAYTLELQRVAYHRSGEADRWRHLVPAARLFRDTMDWEDAGEPNATQGSGWWAASHFRGNPHFGPTVLACLDDLASDPTLASVTDPFGDGHPYVDQALVDRMRAWVDEQFNGQGAALWYALGDVVPCAPHTGKNNVPVTSAFENDLVYYRATYPLLTKHVVHTDRVLVNFKRNGAQLSAAAHGGANITQGLVHAPLLRWERRGVVADDVTVLVNHRAWDGTEAGAFLYQFGGEARPMTVMLEQGLVPGAYEVEWGAVSGNCDTFDTGAVTELATVQHGGAGSARDITLQPGLNLVRVVRLGDTATPPADFELALDPPRLAARAGPGVLDLLFQARATNLGTAASPPATVTLHATLIDPSGAPVDIGSPATNQEAFLAALALPPVQPASGYDLDLVDLELAVPVNDLVVAVLVQLGLGIQLRAEIDTGTLEVDQLNNSVTRAWFLGEIEFE